jgi:hypothetical protein
MKKKSAQTHRDLTKRVASKIMECNYLLQCSALFLDLRLPFIFEFFYLFAKLYDRLKF